MGKLNGILVVETLSDLGYFKYTFQEDIETVKTEIIEGFVIGFLGVFQVDHGLRQLLLGGNK